MPAVAVAVVGMVIAVAASTVSMIQQKKNAEAAYTYKSKVLQAQADQQKAAIEQEAQIMTRQAKYQQGTMRATGAAMGLGMGGSSFEDVTQMNIGLATMDIENKRYEADLAQWEADMQKANAEFERNTTVTTANVGIAANIIGGFGTAMKDNSEGIGSFLSKKKSSGLLSGGTDTSSSSVVSGGSTFA